MAEAGTETELAPTPETAATVAEEAANFLASFSLSQFSKAKLKECDTESVIAWEFN